VKRSLPLVVALLALGLALLLGVRSTFAQGGPTPKHFPHAPPTPPPSPAGPGKIRLTTDDGGPGPLVLAPKNGGFLGEFVVWNDGQGPLTVSRVTTRGDDDDPRLPSRITARFSDGGGGGSVIQPHSSKRVTVTWTRDREPKLHEAIGHVVLTSNDEVAGEVAFGFVAPLTGPISFITSHLLTWLLLLPLAGALLALGMHLAGDAAEDRLRRALLGLTSLQCLLAIILYEGFSGAVTRADGNDGFQFIERSVLSRSLAVEYFVGVDGTSVSLVLLTAVVGFVGAVASYGLTGAAAGKVRAYHGFFCLLLAGVMGVFVSLDLSLLVASWVTMLAALYGVVRVWRGPEASRATRKLAAYGGASAALLIFATGALYLHSDPTFLADGARAQHTFAIPELMRVAYNAKHLELFGCAWVKVVWVALFLGFAVVTPVVPFHGWFTDLMDEAPAPVAAVLAGVVVNAGVYGLLRVSFSVLPDGSRWAAATIVALGALNVAFAAAAALRARRLGEIVAWAAIGPMGFSLIGLGALTREGAAGCLIQLVSHGLILALLVVLARGLRDRTKTDEVERLGGLAGEVPLFSALLGGALLASAGLPGLSGFWGEVMPLLGAFPVGRAAVVVAAVGAGLTTAYHLRTLQRLLAGRFAESWRRDPALAASGGALPDLGARELAAVTPLVVFCLALGLAPAPFFTLVQGGVSDLNQLVNPPGPDEIALLEVPPGG